MFPQQESIVMHSLIVKIQAWFGKAEAYKGKQESMGSDSIDLMYLLL